MKKFDLSTNEKIYFNEYNHNEKGDPHPQYLARNNYRIIPNVGHGNYIKLFSISKGNSYKYVNENCSFVSIFDVTKINKGDESHCRIKLTVNKTDAIVSIKSTCLNGVGNLYEKIWVTHTLSDNKKDLVVNVYLEYLGNDYYAIQNTFQYASSELHTINTDYNFDYTFGEKETTISDNKVPVTVGNNIIFRSEIPSSMTSGGTKGQIAIDTNYIYICWAYGRWSRIPNKWNW